MFNDIYRINNNIALIIMNNFYLFQTYSKEPSKDLNKLDFSNIFFEMLLNNILKYLFKYIQM